MNAKVQEFINKMKEEQRKKELKQKEELLISLGLVDESKTIKRIVYLNDEECKDSTTSKWDAEKQMFYEAIMSPAPIEVTDEEYQEILKYSSNIERRKQIKKDNKETPCADTINVIVKIFLVINIIGGLILSIQFGWIPIVVALTYGILWYSITVGFSKIVKVAEKTLQE